MNIHIGNFLQTPGMPARAICGEPIEHTATEVIAPHDDERLCPGCRQALKHHVVNLSYMGGILSSSPTRKTADGTFAESQATYVARVNVMAENMRQQWAHWAEELRAERAAMAAAAEMPAA